MSTVSVATTVKSDLATIRHYLDHHTGLGVQRVYLFLDDCAVGILVALCNEDETLRTQNRQHPGLHGIAKLLFCCEFVFHVAAD